MRAGFYARNACLERSAGFLPRGDAWMEMRRGKFCVGDALLEKGADFTRRGGGRRVCAWWEIRAEFQAGGYLVGNEESRVLQGGCSGGRRSGFYAGLSV